MLQATDVWFGYDEAAPVVRGVSLACRRRASSGSSARTGPARRRCCACWRARASPQRGTVTLDGAPLDRPSAATALARRMAVVPQETQLAFDYTVAEVAMMGRYPHLGAFEIEGPADLAVIDETLSVDRDAAPQGSRCSRRSAAARSSEWSSPRRWRRSSAMIGIPPKGGSYRPKGSGGIETGYLLLDEPTASLDLGYQLEVAALLRRLHDERGVAIVISTHDLGLAGDAVRQPDADPRRPGRRQRPDRRGR